MAVTFDVDVMRLQCTCCRRFKQAVRRGWCDECRAERAQAGRDRKRAERAIYKREHGIKDPTIRGWWTERRLCPDDPKTWCVAVRGIIGELGELRDVAVQRADGRRAHVRGAMICSYAELMVPNYDWNDDPSLPRYVEMDCTLLRSGKDLPAGRPELRELFMGGLIQLPGGLRKKR